jgi:hypothetical protein
MSSSAGGTARAFRGWGRGPNTNQLNGGFERPVVSLEADRANPSELARSCSTSRSRPTGWDTIGQHAGEPLVARARSLQQEIKRSPMSTSARPAGTSGARSRPRRRLLPQALTRHPIRNAANRGLERDSFPPGSPVGSASKRSSPTSPRSPPPHARCDPTTACADELPNQRLGRSRACRTLVPRQAGGTAPSGGTPA